MGIIEKQATKNAIFSYLGAGLGFLTVLWLPQLLSTDENGLLRLLVSVVALLAQFGNLGFTSVTIRFFPYFRNKANGHNGFLSYALVVSFIGFLLCWIVFLLFKKTLIETNLEKSGLFVDYLYYLMPLTFFTIFFNLFDSYLRAGFNSVIGSFTKDFLQRILILALLAIYFGKLIDFNQFVFFYIAVTCLPTLILFGFILYKKEWHIKIQRGFLSKELKTDIYKLSFYAILSGGAGAIILNIDAIMINQILGLKKTGIYGIAMQFGTIMLIPARSLYRIMSSIVAENFKSKNIPAIHKLYNQSCNNQLAIGSLLYIGIMMNLDNIMQILPPEYADGKYVIVVLATGYLIEMATGINQVIIANSPYFRYDAFFVFIMVVIVIVANIIFIPVYGIIGSAIATAITTIANNLLRFLFLRIKYEMQPYDVNSVKLLAIAAISYLAVYFIPALENLYVDIAVRSGIAVLVFLVLLLKLEAAPELNHKIRKNLKHLSIGN
ncbi:MAG: oligosaccharide flippase family protein [Bacteroidota bacterium]|nr:oligosaccharide flippase family protein [Bacteroidota bacterium]